MDGCLRITQNKSNKVIFKARVQREIMSKLSKVKMVIKKQLLKYNKSTDKYICKIKNF